MLHASVAFIYARIFVVVQATGMKLRRLKFSLKDEKVVKDLYDQFNDSDEGLTESQFGRLATELGAELTLNEVSVTMVAVPL
jgi:hypothetical protein